MSSIPAPYKPLLAARQVERLPIATPLDLAELPIVRSVQKLEAPVDGELPPEAYRSRVRLTGPSGTRIEFVLEGSTEAGLPYGYDGEVCGCHSGAPWLRRAPGPQHRGCPASPSTSGAWFRVSPAAA